MKRTVAFVAIVAISITAAHASELNHFVKMNEKATFIEGVDVVQVPTTTEYSLQQEYSVAEDAAAMSAFAVSSDGTQYKSEISEESLSLLRNAIQTLREQGLDSSIFSSGAQSPTKEAAVNDSVSSLQVIVFRTVQGVGINL
ncbi:hypothetical protein [Photobacterium sp. 1_MG-2023]|uniref:hypothetical protein n=1 Tax=Photobacterium sp. 1_MG-2023 TaxID=3062646 RepID=UPI0026E22FF5|nr:hypothetical protein [Photobacterium sp. 1_MG-2023]MDO6708325.1 hypothetical protein [Photobacterium sp. 1_MG-2023]